jgi:hypothetical protein
LLVGILTPAIRAIRLDAPFRRRFDDEAERRGTARLDVRWRPAHVENPRKRKKSHALANGAGTQNGFRMMAM